MQLEELCLELCLEWWWDPWWDPWWEPWWEPPVFVECDLPDLRLWRDSALEISSSSLRSRWRECGGGGGPDRIGIEDMASWIKLFTYKNNINCRKCYDQNPRTPLHSLFGKWVFWLQLQNLLISLTFEHTFMIPKFFFIVSHIIGCCFH